MAQKQTETKPILIATFGAIVVALIGAVVTWYSRGEPTRSVEAQGRTPSVARSSQTAQTFPFAVDSKFFPSGWMGDGKQGKQYLLLELVSADVNGEKRIVVRIDYSPGPDGWAGVYWQYPDGNWGTRPGMNLTGASAISFLARGEIGGEVVEFKSGGIRGTHSDSYERSIGKVSLQRSWTAYQIPLADQDLSNVIGAFAWSAPASRTRLTFYIANLEIR